MGPSAISRTECLEGTLQTFPREHFGGVRCWRPRGKYRLVALADPTRRAICQRLAHGRATVGQLASLFP
jgi:hypothetical protein